MADEFIKEKLQMLEEGLEYIDRVLSKIDDVLKGIRKKEHYEYLIQISEGFSAVIQIVEYTASITEIKIDTHTISQFVTDMVDGMENGDLNLVADIIEYEIKPLYEQWSDIFANVIANADD